MAQTTGAGHSEGDENSITNYGIISMLTDRDDIEGIYSDGDKNSITNYGSISTEGEGAVGMYSQGDENTIYNYGSLSTVDEDADGMVSTSGSNNQATNYGSISTVGEGADGMVSTSGSNNQATNYGTILTTGDNADGIYASGFFSGEITNYGSINVTGSNARGIWVHGETGETSTINNGGFISATSEATHAIKGEDGEETVNLFSSSDITGDIDLGAGDDTINYYVGARTRGSIDLGDDNDTANIFGSNTPQYSNTLSIENAESINLHNVVGAVNGGLVVTVDPTGQSVKGPVLNSLCTGLHVIIRKRLNHFKPELIKLASTRIEPGMLKTPDQPQAWGDAFHSYRTRDNHGRLFAYDHEYNGFTGGFERTYKRLRAGVMGGFSRANVEADSESFRTDSNSYFTGIYGQYDFGRYKLSASLIGGYEDHDNARELFDNLSGDETARADFGSLFLSPSVTVRADYTVAHRLLLRPMAAVVYSAGWYDDYHEHGTTRSNLEIDDRTLQSLNSTLQLSAIYMITDGCEFELSGGGTARYTDDGSIDGNLGGSDFRFTATNDDSVYSGQLGAYLGVNVSDQLNLYVNAEFSEASGDETQDFFMAGLKFSF